MHTPSLPPALWPAGLALLLLPPALGQETPTPSWHQYVRSPPSSIVRPASILSDRTHGNVTNPDGLITGASGATLFTGSSEDEVSELVVDFGQNVVGTLLLEFAGSTNGSA